MCIRDSDTTGRPFLLLKHSNNYPIFKRHKFHAPSSCPSFDCLLRRASAKKTVKARTGGWCMKLVPLEDRVIVRVLEEEERTSSGIVLPDTAKEKPQKAKVVAVGPGRYEDGKQIPVGVSEGDTVVFSKYGGSEVAVEGEELLVLRASDILAKVE